MPQEKDRSENSRNQIPKSRTQGSAADAKAANDDEDIIQDYICQAGQEGQAESQPGFPRSYKKIGQYGLYHVCGNKQEQHPQIIFAIGKKQAAGAKGIYDVVNPYDSGYENDQPDDCCRYDQQGKILSGLIILPGAHFSGNNRVSPCGDHGSKPYGDIDDGTYNVDGGERVRIYKLGYKNGIYNGIKPHKYHHKNGGKGEL